MLFPPEADYRAWFERAGFEDVAGPRARARLVPRPLRLRRRRHRHQARAGAAPLAAGRRRGPRRAADARGPRALRRALRARLRGRPRVRADRRGARPARPAGPALMAAAGAVAAPARAATVLWRFSRPHTIIGTAVSVAGLFAISVDALGGVDAGTRRLPPVLDARRRPVGQRLHRRDQPDHRRRDRPRQQARPADRRRRPQPRAGVVDRRGRAACCRSCSRSRRARWSSPRCVAALAIGTAYSVPPVRLKRFAIVASLCVSGVRSAIVNLGVAAHFTSALGGERRRSRRACGR